MVDKAFRLTLRNYATLFLLVAAITVPLHLLYSVIFQNVIETRELHSVIETFPESRQVRSVGRAQLTQARLGLAIVTLIELAAIPFLARGTKRVLDRDASDELTSVRDALGAIRTESGPRLSKQRLGPLLVAGFVALAIGFGVESIGRVLLEFVSDERSFSTFGAIRGVAHAAGVPFFLVTLVTIGEPRPGRAPETPPLY